MKKTAIELGFKPEYKEMSEDQTRLLMSVILSDSEIEIPEKEKPFPLLMIEKRIEVLKLPIKITTKAKIAAIILTDGNPGKMNVFLIDCLTNFEGEEVNDDIVCQKMYPMGFYSDKSAMEYIDKFLKTKLCKWSEVY